MTIVAGFEVAYRVEIQWDVALFVIVVDRFETSQLEEVGGSIVRIRC